MHRLTTTALTLTALLFAPAAYAAPAKSDPTHTTIIKIVKSGDGAAETADAEIAGATEKCRAGAKSVDSATETKGPTGKIEKTRIIICSKGDGNETAQMRAALESARDRLSNDTNLSSDAKNKALSAIDDQLNRLRSQP